MNRLKWLVAFVLCVGSMSFAHAVVFYIPEIRPIEFKKGGQPPVAVQTEGEKSAEEGAESEDTPDTTADSTKPVDATYRVPEYDPNFSEVIISGRTKPSDRVWVNKESIPYVTKDKKVLVLKRAEAAIGSLDLKANKDGYFEFRLKLPHEKVQIPVRVKAKGKKSEGFQLQLTVRQGDVTVEDEDLLEQSPELRKKFRVWLGVGYNYLSYSQDSVSHNIDVGYESFKGPTILAQFGYFLSDIWHLEASYKTSPGSVVSSATSQIIGGEYNWTIASLHGTYYAPHWRPRVFGKYKSRVGMIFGVQHHTVPFLARQVGGTGTIKENAVTMVAGGGKLLIDKGKDWAFEVFMRAQFPVATGDVFDINYRMAFDGSLGTFYNFRNGLRAGVFWYGQYHQYSFTHYDVTVPGYISGNEALLFSTLEGRIGYSF